jgi:hypothetical protein
MGTPRLIQRAYQRAILISDPVRGFPSRPAAIAMPRQQAGHMKATDPNNTKKAVAIRGRPHMNHISQALGIHFMGPEPRAKRNLDENSSFSDETLPPLKFA